MGYTLKSCVMILLKLYWEVIFSNWRIGEEDDNAPIATCGYLSLNHAANTKLQTIIITLYHFKFMIILKIYLNKEIKEIILPP